MIVPMKRVSLVTVVDDRSRTLKQLRDLGLMHIAVPPVQMDSTEALREQKVLLERIQTIIPPPEKGKKPRAATIDGDSAVDEALDLAEVIVSLADERVQLMDERDRLQRELERMQPWGPFDPERVRELASGGIHLLPFEGTPERVEEVSEAFEYIVTVKRTKTLHRIVAIHCGESPPVLSGTLSPVALPETGAPTITARIAEIIQEIGVIDRTLQDHTAELPLIGAALEQLTHDLEFARVAATMDTSASLAWISGYIPHDRLEPLREEARKSGWGLVIDDPRADEPVPTELRNPKPIRIIKPVFDLLGTVPGYREMDISFFFLIFFVVFFAMIIGDGGYGLILLIGTLIAAAKGRSAGKAPGSGTVLMIVLSSATVVWGAVTGNWFGYAPFADLPVLQTLVIPQISIDNDASTRVIQYMCFVIGTVHLSIAHIWKFLRGLREKPRVAALAQIGWLSMVLGLYYLVLQLVIDADAFPMPDFAVPMIAGGLAAVIVFGAQEQGVNFFFGIGKGVAGIITTTLDSISAFSDIISYIRLFAVGLATLAIAEAFNSMAGGVAEGLGGAGGAVAAVLILFLGHTLNLAMGALSVVVHGVRLNMLEFSGHLGMEWTGVEYAPFKSR